MRNYLSKSPIPIVIDACLLDFLVHSSVTVAELLGLLMRVEVRIRVLETVRQLLQLLEATSSDGTCETSL